MAKARYMVSWLGMCFRGMSVCSCFWCSSAKCCISAKSSALSMVARSAMVMSSFSLYFIFPCWRVSVLFMIAVVL